MEQQSQDASTFVNNMVYYSKPIVETYCSDKIICFKIFLFLDKAVTQEP